LIKDQLNFMQNKSLGYDKDQILVINSLDSLAQTKFKVLKDVLEQKPLIQAVTSSSSLPGTSVGETVFKVEKDSQMQQQEFKTLQGDQDYLKTFGMKVKMGRVYRSDDSQANGSFVVNETAAKLLGWENPIDKKWAIFIKKSTAVLLG
jgi:putative ABC transport system permease protein